ncbi:MAG: endo-1,4-beta-xylanase [Patescibacteria group bacterium]
MNGAVDALAAAEDILGVNVHAVQRYAPGEYSTLGDHLQADAMHWAREEFYWDRIEPAAGNFQWAGYDEVVALYQAKGVSVLGLLAYSSQWASSWAGAQTADDHVFSSPDLTAWATYVRTVVSRYKGTVHAWEIWNEPDAAHFLRPSPGAAAYLPVLKAAYAAIKEVDPTATVVTGGTAGVNYSFAKMLYTQGGKGYFDAIGVHAYRTLGSDFRSAPEVSQFGLHCLDVDLAALNAVLAKYDAGRPVWITEFGWPTHAAGVTPAQQAAYLQRAVLIARSQGVAKFFWYDYRDDASGSEQEKSFGLYQRDWTPKPALTAYQEIQRLLGNATFSYWEPVLSERVEDFRNAKGWYVDAWLQGTLRSHVPARVIKNPAYPGGSRTVLRYDFRNAKGSTFANLVGSFPKTYTDMFELWYLGDGSMHDLRFRVIDAQGETFQFTVGPVGSGWQRVLVDIRTGVQRATSWGSKKDGKIQQPVSIGSILLENRSGAVSQYGSIGIGPIRRVTQPLGVFARWRGPSGNVWTVWSDSRGRLANVRSPIARAMTFTQSAIVQSLAPTAGKLQLPFGDRPQFLQ